MKITTLRAGSTGRMSSEAKNITKFAYRTPKTLVETISAVLRCEYLCGRGREGRRSAEMNPTREYWKKDGRRAYRQKRRTKRRFWTVMISVSP